jgi:hypothetical protein
MTAVDCLAAAKAGGTRYQQSLNELMDAFRRAGAEARREMVRDPIEASGPLEGLVAGTVSALCREAGMEAPDWIRSVHSPEPFFAFPARTYEMRVRLMLESPAPFRIRNVFVPENYMERA